jgi:hypothetical protein
MKRKFLAVLLFVFGCGHAYAGYSPPFTNITNLTWDNTNNILAVTGSVSGTSTVTSALTGTFTAGIKNILTYNPSTAPNAAGVVFGLEGQVTFTGTAAPNGGGHFAGSWADSVLNASGITVPLMIGNEGRLDVTAGTCTSCVSSENQLAANTGTVTTWIGTENAVNTTNAITNVIGNQLTLNTIAGNLALAAGSFCPQPTNNTATIATYACVYMPAWGSPGTVTSTYFLLNTNANASIYNSGSSYLGGAVGIGGAAGTAALAITGTLQLDTGTKTATATAGAATLNKASGKITTESLTTAAGATYTLTLTDSSIAAADMVFASLANGTNSTGDPVIGLITPAAGSVTIKVVNRHASAALNGTLVISFASMKA